MAKEKRVSVKPARSKSDEGKKYRNFPRHKLEEALVVAQQIMDEKAGRPFKRLLLADAIGIKPSSSEYRDLLSSSIKYDLTEGSEKASEITLTPLGKSATQTNDAQQRLEARRTAAFTPEVFGKFYRDYADHRVPTPDMLRKLLISDYGVPADHAEECETVIMSNGRFVDVIRDIGGSPHVLLEAEVGASRDGSNSSDSEQDPPPLATPATPRKETLPASTQHSPPSLPVANTAPKPIFIGHGKNKQPLQKLQAILSSFQIPHRVTIDEANLGRPIPQKVKDTMLQCGSAILIFTRDEKLQDVNGNEIWRPSENVVHELGAASFAYEDRIVIFKEKGLNFPTNFQSIGYIEFEVDSIEAKATDLLKELIGFGLVKITPA